jgi:hypothetical protein
MTTINVIVTIILEYFLPSQTTLCVLKVLDNLWNAYSYGWPRKACTQKTARSTFASIEVPSEKEMVSIDHYLERSMFMTRSPFKLASLSPCRGIRVRKAVN